MHGQCEPRAKLPYNKERLIRLMVKRDGLNSFFTSDRERLTLAEFEMKAETLNWCILCVAAALHDLEKASGIRKLMR